jgi:phosphohistidine phosphatase SixA
MKTFDIFEVSRKGPWKIWIGVLLGMGLLWAPAKAASPGQLIAELKSGGHILMIRHAYAPGTGDPDDFRIGDCDTQRNLDDQGRAQARKIGQWLQRRGIETARIYSSQWCRCLETARLLELGPVTELTALNSFFERPQDREPNLAALRVFLAQQPTDGPLIILVTHFVTISGITGEGVASGQGMVLKIQSDGGVKVIGPLGFD